MRRKTVTILAATATLVLGTLVALPAISFYMLTGRFSPIHKIETLQNPVTVTKWSSDGLHLIDGRMVQLPGLRSLPSESAALAEVTKRGVELDSDGRVWGLVRVHHWCGNDAVREHIARVDFADMLAFLRVGEPIATAPQPEFLTSEPGGTFSKWGWRVGEYFQFQSWEKSESLERQ